MANDLAFEKAREALEKHARELPSVHYSQSVLRAAVSAMRAVETDFATKAAEWGRERNEWIDEFKKMQAEMDQAAATERDACAKVADEIAVQFDNIHQSRGAAVVAKGIRARAIAAP